MNITDKKQTAQFIVLLFITSIMLYICWQMIEPFIMIILWSSILVIIFFPVYKTVLKKFKREPISAIATIVISFLVFIIPMVLVIISAINEIAGLINSSLTDINKFLDGTQQDPISNLYAEINKYIKIEKFISLQELKNYVGKLSETMLQATISLAGSIIGTIVSIFFAAFTMYYLFRDGKKIVTGLHNILPLPQDQAEKMIRQTTDIISSTLNGTLLIASLQGLVAGVLFWLLGVPSPVLLGALTMLVSLIPVVGTGIVTVPVVLYFVFTGDYLRASILTAFAVLVIGMLDNYLLPILIGKRAKMHELLVFFSVIGGLQLFGLIGIFLGPVIIAIAFGLFTVFKGEKISKDPLNL